MRKSTENEEMEREWGHGKRMRKWRGNGEKMRKLRGNGKRMKKWREISSLSNNFLFLLCNYFTTTLKYVTFCRKNLYALWMTMSPNIWLFCAVCQTRILMEPAKVGMIVLSQHRRHDKSCASSRRRTWLCWWRTMKRLQKKGNKLGFVDA